MKALLGDGRVIDLGNKFIQIIGEPDDERELIVIQNVGATSIGCWLRSKHDYLEIDDTSRVVRVDNSEKNTADTQSGRRG